MLDLARPDPEGERAQRAVRRGVAVAADQRRARQREAELGADHVDDPLLGRGRVDVVDAEFGGVGAQRVELRGALRIGDRQQPAVRPQPRRRRQIVVRHRQRQFRPAHPATRGAQPLERLRARHLVDQVAVDVDQAGAVVAPLDDVGVPDLLVQG